MQVPFSSSRLSIHLSFSGNNQLIIFGGMGNTPNSSNTEDLCVLNDIRFLDLSTMHWLPASSTNGLSPDAPADTHVPKPRYAHLSSVTADRLFIIGGQDLTNMWLDDVYVYDLLGKAWVQRRNFPHHCGTYRSVAVSANLRVRLPHEESRATDNTAILGSPGTRFRSDKSSPSSQEFTPTESLVHLPHSASPTDDFPNDIFLYSNYNFTDVKRELQVFSPLPDTDFTITDRSTAMTGTSFPPGLRFPSGAILGTHFLIAGTYLAHTYQSYSIWALDLLTMTWSRIDPGNAVASGSWFRACLWAEANKFVIFGNRNGNLVEDYNRRLLSWDHVAVIDLESFGIYQPPPLQIDVPMQEFGLSALEEGVLADFEIVCDDGRKIKCSRKILEDRWPWFMDQRVKFLERAHQAIEILPSSSMDVGLPDLPGAPDSSEPRPDPRLTPRAFHLSEPYPITLALLQYFYSLALITPLQHAPAVLSQLLILANSYQITHLEALVKHAMHQALSNSTSVGVYEVATLCSCRSLQIRALKTVMSYSQKRTGRSRADSKGGGGGNRNLDPGDSDHHGRGSDETLGSSARTRGASDGRPSAVDQQQTLRSAGAMLQESNPDLVVARHVAVASRDAGSYEIPVPSSQISQQLHKATLSESTLIPPRSWTMPNHSRPFSIVSAHTDFELCAVAELLSSAVSHTHSFAEEQEATGVGLDDVLDDYLDASIKPCNQRQRNASITPYLLLECEEPFSPPDFSYSPASGSFTPSESESESLPDDNHWHPHPPSFPYHFPRRVRRKHSSAGVSTSDSDTPSLSSSTTSASSSHSRSYSPPSSPATLKTPVDHVPSSPHTLAIIEEQSTGNQGAHRPATDSRSLYGTMEIRPKTRKVENLRVNVPPRTVPFPILTHSPSSTIDCSPFVATAISRTVLPSPRPGLKSLTRIMSPVSKPSKSFESNWEPSSTSPTMSVSTSKFSKEDAKEEKFRRAEAKRMKKAEQRAKVERLAEELKERKRRKTLAQDEDSAHSDRSGGRDDRRHWDTRIAMYDGLGNAM
ncbi:hypothetical protein JVT61DRAFT_1098 [Boletus reticuloceps]|uniref:Regulatory protein ral2 n=1 Tax=Boletus reticuloceps TaxID=495285 RepID=A0A8I2YPW3_9AGAM|nr:hypothetical protein JVT61DRAFT_1098 [Boletus reticuloceps]